MDVRMPDGTVISGVPDTATKEDVAERYSAYQASLQPEKEATLGSRLVGGAKQLVSSATTGVKALVGSPEEAAAAAKAGLEEQARIEKEKGRTRGFAETKQAYETKGGGLSGILAGAGEFVSQVPGAVVENLPQLGAALTGARVGAMVGAPFAGVGAIPGAAIGAGIGALSTMFPGFMGSNVVAQAEKAKEENKPLEVNKTNAALAAAGQSALETAGGAYSLGKNLLTKLITPGKVADALKDTATAEARKAATEELVKTAGRSLLAATGRGAARGAAEEVPVEILQLILEDAQAGRDSFSPEGLTRLGHAAYGALQAGPVMGAGFAGLDRSSAKSQLAAQGVTPAGAPSSSELSPEEKAVREEEQQTVGHMRARRDEQEAAKAAQAPFIGQDKTETPEGQFGLNLEGGKRVAPSTSVQGTELPERKPGFDAYGRPKAEEPTTAAPTPTGGEATPITQALDTTQPVQQHRDELAALTQRLAETPDTRENRALRSQINGRIGVLNKLIKTAESVPVGTQGALPVVPTAEPTQATPATPEAPAPTTSALVRAAGIPASAPIAQQLKKLDLAQQADRTAAAEFIAQALANKNVRPETKTAIQAFYDQHIAQPVPDTQGGLDLGEPQPLVQVPPAATTPAAPITPPAAPTTPTGAVTPDTAPSLIDDSVWNALGIGPTAKIRKNVDVNGKDITDPTDGAFVRKALEAYRDASKSARIKANIDKYLARFPVPAATITPPPPPPPPPQTPVEKRVASGQVEAWAQTQLPYMKTATVVYADPDIALVYGQTDNGFDYYVMSRRSLRLLHISNASRIMSAAEVTEINEAKKLIEARDNAALTQTPDGPFTNAMDNVVGSASVDPRYVQYLTALMQKLGMGNINVFLYQDKDIFNNKDQYNLYGGYSIIVKDPNHPEAQSVAGALAPFGPAQDAFAINLADRGFKPERVLETIAHELGHGIEFAAFTNAPKATQNAVLAEYRAWRKTADNMTREEFYNALRNRNAAAALIAKTDPVRLGLPASTIPGFDSYWASFPEWFADNVSRWATTDTKAVSLVAKFFQDIAKQMRALVAAVTGAQFPSNSAVADFLNAMTPANPVVWKGAIGQTRVQPELADTKPTAPDTPEFKKWFKGSTIVNEDGTPKAMYHGTTGDISEFKNSPKKNRTGMPDGFYFTSDPKEASDYATNDENANVIPVYLNVKNPFNLTGKNKITNEMVMQFRDELRKDNPGLGFDWIQSKVELFKEKAARGGMPFPNISFPTDAMQRVFQVGGYDGLIDGGRHIVAFEPNQIKSAYNQTPTDVNDISGEESLVDQQQMDESTIGQISQSINTPPGQILPATWNNINQAPSQAQRTAMTQFAAVQAQGDVSWADWFRQKTVDVFAPVATKLGLLFDQGVRNSFGDVNPVQFIRQAFDHARVALDVFRQGGLRMNKDGFWESYQLKDANGKEMSAQQVVKDIAELAKKNNEAYNVTKGKVATVLEGMRLSDLRKENATLEALAQGHEANGDFDLADKTREKKFLLHMRFAEIDALEQVFQASPELQEIQRIMNASRESVVDAMVTSGRISAERGDFWKAVTNYVPFDRVNNVYEDLSLTQRPTRKGVASLGELPKLRGSLTRPVANTVDNYMNTMAWMVDQSMRNSAAVRVLNLMATPGVDMANKLPSMNQATNTHMVVPKLYENGEPVYFELHSLYDFAAFVQAPEIKSGALKLLGASSRLLRTTVTATPMFAIKQVIDDAQRVMFYSGVKNPTAALATVFKHFPSAWFGAWIGKQPALEKKLVSLGIIGDYDFNPVNPIETLEYQTGAEKRGGVRWLINKLEQVTKASDMAARMAVYEQTLKETGDPAVAQVRARELINFNRRGSSTAMNVMTQTVPFFNAYAQGLDLMYRGVTGKDASSGLNKSAARNYFISRMVVMSVMGLFYAAAMSDDEQYEDLTDEVRDRNWILPKSINEGLGLPFAIKISVPSELGFIFKSIPERIMSYRKYAAKGEDQGAGRAAIDALLDGLKNYATVPIPPVVKSAIENTANYSFFTHRELVPKAMQERPPALQYTSNTSELGKAIGKAGDVSPIKVDNWIRGTFGLMGASGLLVTDAMMNPARPDRSLAQIPFMSLALVNPAGSRVKDEFYDFRQKITEAVAAKNMLEKENPAKYAEFVQKNYHLLAAAPYVNQKLKVLSELRAAKEMFTHMPATSMTSAEKRKNIDEINKIEKVMLSDMRTMRSAIQKAAPK